MLNHCLVVLNLTLYFTLLTSYLLATHNFEFHWLLGHSKTELGLKSHLILWHPNLQPMFRVFSVPSLEIPNRDFSGQLTFTARKKFGPSK